VDEQELLNAVQKSGILDELYSNPKTKAQFLGLLKETRPSLSIPEIDGPAAIQQHLQPQLEQIEKARQEVNAQAARLNIREKYGMSDEEISEVAQTMQRDKVGSFDTAVELTKYRSVTPRNGQNSGPVSLPDSKELFANPQQWARNEAHKVINELQRGRRIY
jgi:hypothetical protein